MASPAAPVTDGTTPNDPIGGATNIGFVNDPVQCKNTTVTWVQGQPPVRLEFYQQNSSNSEWDVVPFGMYNVYYDPLAPNVTYDWTVNVEGGKRLWVVIVDHTGAYSQNREPFIVGESDSYDCITEPVVIDRHPALLPTSSLVFLSFMIFFLGLCVYLFFAWRKALHQAKRSRDLRATIDDSHSIFSPASDAAPYTPYMIQRTQSNQSTIDARASRSQDLLPSAVSQDSNPEQALWMATAQRYNQGGAVNRGSLVSSNNPFSDDSAASPTETITSRMPLIKEPSTAVTRMPYTESVTDQESNLSRRPSENYSISSEQSSLNRARRPLSIVTAATKASSNENSDEVSTLSRQTSVSTSDNGSMQFFPMRINQNQNGTWSTVSNKNPFT